MSEPLQLPGIEGPTVRRGRPRGSGNKRSSDLARYVAARFGGLTPGQQAAELVMIPAAELRRFKADARELGVHPMLLAMAHRATVLGRKLGCDKRDAMLLLLNAQKELLPYVHQRLPQAPEPPAPGRRTVAFGVPDLGGRPQGDPLALPAPVGVQTLDGAGLFDSRPEAPPPEVTPPKSHDAPEPEAA